MKLKKVRVNCELCGKEVYCEEFLLENRKPSDMCIVLNNSAMKHIKIEKEETYKNIPLEKRQKFLDVFWTGKTVGESYKAAGLTQDEGFAVMDKNIESRSFLRTEAKGDSE